MFSDFMFPNVKTASDSGLLLKMYKLCHTYKCWNAVSSGGLVGLSTNSTDFCWTKQTICEREKSLSVFFAKTKVL